MNATQLRRSLVTLMIFSLPGAAQTAQALPAQTPPQAASQTTPNASSILNPAISTLQAALDGIRVERWKTSGSVRGEAEDNIASVRRDLETTLPPLITAADAAPDSAAQILPAYRNVEALYDVLLRISSVARLAAPAQQSDPLEQAISSMESSRRALGDRLQSVTVAQEHKVSTMQAALHAAPPPAPAPAPCPPAPAAAKKRKSHARTAPHPKPATNTTPAPATAPSPH